MTNSQVHPQGWISLLIAPEYEERAKQMRAERDRRALILTAEGTKQSAILTAEGTKQAAILNAEGSARAAVLEAGIKFNDVDLAAFRKAAQPLLDEYHRKPEIEALYRRIRDLA